MNIETARAMLPLRHRLNEPRNRLTWMPCEVYGDGPGWRARFERLLYLLTRRLPR
jgi:hypothetical protein